MRNKLSFSNYGASHIKLWVTAPTETDTNEKGSNLMEKCRKKNAKKNCPTQKQEFLFFSFPKFEKYRQRTKLTKSEEMEIVMNSGLIPYKRRFLYDDEEGTGFTPMKPVLMKYWVSYNEMGAGTPAMKMRAREKEREKTKSPTAK